MTQNEPAAGFWRARCKAHALRGTLGEVPTEAEAQALVDEHVKTCEWALGHEVEYEEGESSAGRG